ncbi:aminotransferase class I/II-fold pyridoxal phosphate-dependent enzyme [Pusillimonas sp. TS35]|uniref:aminotransferase-like domain-containing protein n=1 Tax=Paracandidimonas lactea TaxID=2895524 RepID=UPI00136C2C5C|nr:PLP-dependent aminotransferase family protein [Paracandidimonas lactea]MYN14627.1 aminotransferase class I/II-fold pyridoxal phosphate-dependent enzyme [Pusillimonas sp. TS35]
MRIFEPSRDRQGAGPLVDQIVGAVSRAICEQALRAGMMLPSVRAFARAHGLSPYTVSVAYSRLVAQNWLVVRPGSGYRVAPQSVWRQAAAEAGIVVPAVNPNGLGLESEMRTVGKASAVRTTAVSDWTPPSLSNAWLLADVFADHSIPIKSGCGWLPTEWLDEPGLRQALRQVARTPINQLAGYGHPYGYFPLREYVRQSLTEHGLAADVEQILLTQGATQGLDIVLRTLLRPGDAVAVELPCYANLLPTLRLAGLTVHGVRRDAQGLDIAGLEAMAQASGIKALFVTTVLHNPTGTSLSMHNAFRVLQLAEHYDFRIIEDDVSRELLPGLGPMLAAMAEGRRVIQVSGFSKRIVPSMRVGYIVADAALIRDFATTKMALGLTTPEMMERTVHHVLRQGRHCTHLQRIQARLSQAHDAVCALMDEHGVETFARPGAGLFLWARLPGAWHDAGALRLTAMALRDGIWLAPGAYFDPTQADTGWLRFNVAYSTHPGLWTFIRKAKAL